MTIAAAYLVSDGVVFGADSSSTVEVNTPQGKGVAQLLNHAQKIFEIGDNSRLGICTYGSASLGNISHRTAVARLADKINKDTTVDQASDLFIKIIREEVGQQAAFPLIGYFFGGWNPNTHKPECFQIEFSQGTLEKKPLQQGACVFAGDPIFFSRVFWGFDPRLREELKQSYSNQFQKSPEEFDAIFNPIAQKYITAGFQDLPIREAIDFINSYLHITIKAQKFRFGPPSCGGSIEIGFITTDRNFRWARHKTFYSAITGQEGEYDD